MPFSGSSNEILRNNFVSFYLSFTLTFCRIILRKLEDLNHKSQKLLQATMQKIQIHLYSAISTFPCFIFHKLSYSTTC